jgi:hypothetical protein
MRSQFVAAACGALGLAVLVAACGGTGRSGFDVPDGSSPRDGGGGGTDDAPEFVTDGAPVDVIVPDVAPPEPVTVVYGHSPSVLYKLDPKTKAVTTVGTFDCSNAVIDLAIDENNKAYITSFGAFYSLDLNTAKCTQIATGNYPNSLSFVPKGTLDPNAEALVGYFGSTYVRIDTSTGQVSNVGALSGGYWSSGDIVSVKNGGTFLTVKGPGCGDCLVQIDPKTGNLVQSYGPLGYVDVYGIAFWGGKVYGFDNGGDLFEVSANGNQIFTTPVPIPNKPPNLQFWGAGSSTSVPATGDGGTIPVK